MMGVVHNAVAGFPLRLPASLALLTCLALLPVQGSADTRVQFSTGFIAAVGIEVDEEGHPMLAEYDANGYLVGDVGYLGLGELEDVTLYRASDWRAFRQLHEQLQASNPLATRGARLMSREQYESRQFTTRSRNPVSIDKPRLLENTRSVYVVSEDRMLVAQPAKSDFVLAEYPVALHQEINVTEDMVTLILNADGEIVRSSKHDISVKAAVYREENRRSNDGFERLWQPIANAQVSAGDAELNLFPGGRAVSQEDGRYSMTYVLPPCPGFYYEIDVPIIATLNIENFNPKADDQGFLTALRTDPKVCVGFGDVPLGSSLAAISAQLAAQAIVATLATPVYTVDVTFSTMQLNGLATIPDVKLGGNTVYSEDSEVNPLEQGDYRFDFNLDGVDDVARINAEDNSRIDIWISPNQPVNQAGDPLPPDLTRAADFELADQLAHQGLLSEISQSDLEDSDIYIFRRSTGQLIGSIEGLAEFQPSGGVVIPGAPNPDGRATYRGVHTDEDIATFGFTSFLVGAVSSDVISSLRNSAREGQQHRRPWLPSDGSAGGFAGDRAPESLRPGEVVQVIAINRATGYIGSQDVTIQPSGATLVPPTPIRMGPPNLKIVASRSFRDRNELSGIEEERVNIIGSEGAGLASDTYVKIQSIWLAANGDVLPEGLPGYTGRVAISTGSSTEDFSGNFEIKPGYQTQLVQLNNASDLRLEHFYVQVVGEPTEGNPQFESPGAGEGKLQTRPKKYVPILVPIHDEIATRDADMALARARLDGVDNLPPRAEPIYHWVYRPELQFSVYELKQNELQLRYEVVEGEEATVVNLADIGQNEFNEILNQVSVFELLYDLGGPESEALEFFGQPRELLFSIGEQEAQATLLGDGVVRFDNLEHLDLLTETDYLAISLFDNGDSANRLWEWAFLANIYFVDGVGRKLTGTAGFSHPSPVVRIGKGANQDDIEVTDVDVLGNSATITITGKVFCDLADLIEDPNADITEVTVVVPRFNSSGGYQRIPVAVSNTSNVDINDYLPFGPDSVPDDFEQADHPFMGEFETTVNVELVSGSVTVLVEATNAIGNKGYDSITVSLAQVGDRMIVADVSNNAESDRGLFRPLWMQIEDPLIDSTNINEAVLTVFGREWTVVEKAGKFYANRAFIQVGRELRDGIEAFNIANVESTESDFENEYTSPSDEFVSDPVTNLVNWSYTAASPPNFFKYAAGSTVGVEWHSGLLNDGWEVQSAKVIEKNGWTWLTGAEEDSDSDVLSNSVIDPRDGKNGVLFAVQLGPRANEQERFGGGHSRFSDKRIEIVLKKDGETKIDESADFRVVPLKTVILAIDGFAYDSADAVINQAPNFKKIFDNAIGRNEKALAALPTITWANWPGVFGGKSPSLHGILGNSYFPRETPFTNRRYPVVSGGTHGLSTTDTLQQIGVARGGSLAVHAFSMDQRALDSAGSIYDDIADALNKTRNDPLRVRSIRPFYTRNGEKVNMDDSYFFVADALLGHSLEDAAVFDDGEDELGPDSIGTGPQSETEWPGFIVDGDIMSLYYPGPDNAGHGLGGGQIGDVTNPVSTIVTAANGATNNAVGRLLRLMEDQGYMNAVMFGLVADHGQHQYRTDPEFVLLTEEIQSLFETPVQTGGLGMKVWRSNTDSNAQAYLDSRVAFAPNGGLVQFYLRSAGQPWQSPPTAVDVKAAASLLYREAVGHDPARVFAGYSGTQVFPDLAPRTSAPITSGAFGSPPAIFVKYTETPGENGFMQDFKWVKGISPNPLDPDDVNNLETGTLAEFLAARRAVVADLDWPAFEARMEEMNHKFAGGSRTGDIVAILDGREGYLAVNTVDDVYPGWHGGPTVSESLVPLMFGMPGTAFVDGGGGVVTRPEALERGYVETASNIRKSDGFLRNWQFGAILQGIQKKFRLGN